MKAIALKNMNIKMLNWFQRRKLFVNKKVQIHFIRPFFNNNYYCTLVKSKIYTYINILNLITLCHPEGKAMDYFHEFSLRVNHC